MAQQFPELDLSIHTNFRQLPPGVTQDMIKNPNGVLQKTLDQSLQGTTMRRRTFLHVSTTGQLIKGGGGTANTAFLASSHNPAGGNARAARVEATFWIETIAGTEGQPDIHQLQYTQLVMLDFNGIHWPHVTVGPSLSSDPPRVNITGRPTDRPRERSDGAPHAKCRTLLHPRPRDCNRTALSRNSRRL